MKKYVPVWFHIKRNNSVIDGAMHELNTITTPNYIKKKLQEEINCIIERGVLFAHPENLLLSIITDEKEHARELRFIRDWKAIPAVTEQELCDILCYHVQF